MALTIINGRTSIGNIPNIQNAPNDMLEMVALIEAGNSVTNQNNNILNAILQPMERSVERKDGTPLPVEVHNVKFSEGGIMTSAKEFRPYMDKLELDRSVGYNVMNFNYDEETLLAAKRGEINLEAQKLKSTKAIMTVHTNKYLPYSRLKAVITGTTLSETIPTLDPGTTTGVFAYTRSFGFARGEDFCDFITVATGDAKRNFYRTTETGSVADTDITNLADDLEAVDTYSRQGIVAFGHPRTVQNLGSLAKDTMNQDIEIFGDVAATNMFGINWVKVPGFHPDFVIMLDMGKTEELLIRGIEKEDADQRGLGIVVMNDLTAFDSVQDLNGAKMRIFPEEWYMAMRLSGGILDTNELRGDVSGYMQDGGGNSVEALELWITTMNGYWKTFE